MTGATAAATVLGWQPERLTSAGGQLERLAEETFAVTAGLDAGVRGHLVNRRWRGPAGAAALQVVERRAQVLRRTAAQLATAGRGLVEGALRLARAQGDLRLTVDRVRSEPRLAYEGSGAVSVDWGLAAPRILAEGPFAAVDLARLTRLAHDLGARVSEAVEQALRVDRECAAWLSSLAAGLRATMRVDEPEQLRADLCAGLGLPACASWLAHVPTTDTAPEAVADWWAVHTPAEQEVLIARRSTQSLLGGLNGLPVSVRDRANRFVLAERLGEYSAALRRLEERLRGAQGTDVGELLKQRAQLVAAHGVDQRVAAALRVAATWLDPITGQPVRCELLTYEPLRWSGKGRVALALGGVDSAADVAYVVPGMGERVDPDLAGLVESVRNLHDAARRLAPRSSVAVVAWLGYDTPGWAQVAFAGLARAGGTLLGKDIDGLRASRRGPDPAHVTVIGHSYGSTAASVGVRQAVSSVDELVFVGSPGVLAGHATDLPVPPGHVWVGAASGDEVSHLSRFGTDPAAVDFGAHRFPAEAPPGTAPFGQHTRYFDRGSSSLLNLARIITGAGSTVPVAPGRSDSGFLGVAERLALTLPAVPVLPLLAVVPALPGFPLEPVVGVDPTFGDPARDYS